MKVSREAAAQNREKVVAAAARLMCERGLDGVGVDAIMREAGLTHGGFYGQFASKHALAAEALNRALRSTLAGQAAFTSLPAYVDAYLAPERREDMTGCGLAAMGVDAARKPGLRPVVEENVRGQLAMLEHLQPGPDARNRALETLSAMVGALILSRAVESEALADEILDGVRRRLSAEQTR